MKTRSLGIAFAALLAFAPVRGHAEEAANAPANAATPTSDRPANAPRPSIAPKTVEGTPAPATEPAVRKRRYAKKHFRRYAYWEPFPIYWPSYYRHHLTWRRVAWFGWF
ncbi:hypothetical protein [Bradyrhizobium sp.]|uniref:hypothetical protein n=1 Tax=Bradyrhizobium sp. TaxID=376 RepID=UPI0040377748